ncbi:hypothetical protein ACFLX2_01010 [Candidatus Dependentiae bacterium]
MSQAIVSFVFRLLNFGVICALATYFIKKKLVPQTEEKIAVKHAVLEDLTSQNKNLLDQQKELEKEADEQEVLGRKLFDQIKIWSVSFDKQLEELKEEQQELAQQSGRRAQEQAERKADIQIRSVILSKALSGAAQHLSSHFSSEKEGRSFTASIVERMRKEVS